MISLAIENLQQVQILNPFNIDKIRNYIATKYTNNNEKHKAIILADAVRKVVSYKLNAFGNYSIVLTDQVIQEAIKKDIFTITGFDVFKTSLCLNILENEFIDALFSWLQQNQSTTIQKDQLIDIIIQLTHEDSNLNLDFDSWIKSYEKQIHLQNSLIHNEIISVTDRRNIKKVVRYNDYIDKLIYFKNYIQILYKASTKSTITNLINAISTISRANFTRIGMPIMTAILIVVILILAGSTTLPYSYSYPSTNTSTNLKLYADLMKVSNNTLKTQKSMLVRKQNTATRKVVNSKSILVKDKSTNSKSNTNQKHFRYEELNLEKLSIFLKEKGSILSQDKYLLILNEVAAKNNVDLLLLLAITGQEQGFVPSRGASARKIANNPFNVFGSWKRYNTNIKDSANIAARLISRRMRSKPANYHPIQWINKTYAQDDNWWKGVQKLYNLLESRSLKK